METLNKLIKIVVSKDGSHSIYRSDIDEHYHSVNGAIQESLHVFINAGLLDHINTNKKAQINILEIGFGTGLNAFLTLLETQKNTFNPIIEYHALEPFPLDKKWVEQLNYPNSLNDKKAFLKLHNADWEVRTKINEHFHLTKIKSKLEDYRSNIHFDIIYYDAFGPNSQEEMWELNQFSKLYSLTNNSGRLVTYCAKGQVRRDLEKVGYLIERLDGPIGKREMLRGKKINSCNDKQMLVVDLKE